MGLRVIDPGLSTTIQDAGRPGYREWGVPPSGAFDTRSAGLANALAANEPDCAVLELTLRGGLYEATIPLALALAGAPMPAKIIRPDHSEHPLAMPQSFSLEPGARLEIGTSRTGSRTYLAITGGWRAPLILGSASSEKPLRANDLLAASASHIPARRPAEPLWPITSTDPIRIIDGPDAHTLADNHPDFWLDRTFRVNPRSNRMGIRLDGDPLTAQLDPHRLSIPVCPGAIQLAGGQLIVLGVACGTMGGYPLIAHVISADLHRLAQLRPVQHVRFDRIPLQQARIRDLESRRTLASYLQRIRTASK